MFVLSISATGDGECIMKYCPSYKLVDLMSQGLDPQKACEKVVTDMMDRNGYRFEVGLIALDMKVILMVILDCTSPVTI